MSLPLFIGLTKTELEEIVREYHFNLGHQKKGSVIVDENEVCQSLIFVVDGWVEVCTYNDPRVYRVVETMQTPMMIEPDKMFGLTQRYHSSYVAQTACDTIALPKEELMHMMERYLIVKLNMLNMLCRKIQVLERQPWRQRTIDLKARVIMFFREHVQYQAGKKIFYIKMTQLAMEVNDSRLNVSIVLNELERDERIILKRGIIEIPALQILNN
jgi:CRP-like cAMP-binding protein